MSEQPAAPRRRQWSLRRRLVVAVVALLAAVGLVVGTVSVLALRQNLVSRLDTQVESVLRSVAGPGGGSIPSIGESTADGFRLTGTVVLAQAPDGQVQGVHLGSNGMPRELTPAQQARLLEVEPGSGPQTVNLGRLGAYRVQAIETPPGVTYVAGLSLADVNATTLNLALIFGLVTVITLLVAGLVAALIVRVALRPLGRVANTASRVAELPLATGSVSLVERVPDEDTDPGTEVGQVGAAFNRMLGHVDEALQARQASEQKVRQFVADASHELRTPLASIRGYSELTRRAPGKLPEDVTRALGRIESESIRMTALVEDLLLLARLDEGRELVLSEVDLVPLIADAVSDAHAAATDHRWAFEMPGEPVLVSGDAARLHQVFANLLSNAGRHTPAGTLVATEITVEPASESAPDATSDSATDSPTEPGWAVVTVEDDGPGIPESLQTTLFERFARGDGSRSRETGSTGLGLAIVSAVVEAHHGEVLAVSEPGRTRFTVRLPLAHGHGHGLAHAHGHGLAHGHAAATNAEGDLRD